MVLGSILHGQVCLVWVAEVGEADFHENYELLKIFIVRAVGPSGIPNLTDFKACEFYVR